MNDNYYLTRAIALSRLSVLEGGFPVGALIVKDGHIIAEGVSNGKQEMDATSHAEIAAMRAASRRMGTRDITNATLYTSMEPCLMCFSASYWAKIGRVVYALSKKKLAPMHYEGRHRLTRINSKNNRSIAITHLHELEDSAHNIVKDWERRIIT